MFKSSAYTAPGPGTLISHCVRTHAANHTLADLGMRLAFLPGALQIDELVAYDGASTFLASSKGRKLYHQ